MQLKITFEDTGKAFSAPLGSVTTVGRSHRNNIQIKRDEVSRFHLQIKNVESKIYVRDLGSANGTMINDALIKAKTDVEWPSYMPIKIGPTISISLETSELAQAQIIIPQIAESTKTKKVAKTTKLKRPTNHFPKKNSANPKLLLVTIAMLVLGSVLYHFRSQEPASTPKAQTYSLSRTKPLPLIIEHIVADKCGSKQERAYCEVLNLKSDFLEGAVRSGDDLLLFLNLKQRFKESFFENTFVWANDDERQIFLLASLGLSERLKSLLLQQKVKTLHLVSVDHETRKAGISLTAPTSKLMALSSFDTRMIYQSLNEERDGLFKKVVLPLFDVSKNQ